MAYFLNSYLLILNYLRSFLRRNGYLDAEFRVEIILYCRTDAVAYVAHVIKRQRYHLVSHRLLPEYIALPMLIKLISEHGVQAGVMVSVVRPIKVIEIASNGK